MTDSPGPDTGSLLGDDDEWSALCAAWSEISSAYDVVSVPEPWIEFADGD